MSQDRGGMGFVAGDGAKDIVRGGVRNETSRLRPARRKHFRRASLSRIRRTETGRPLFSPPLGFRLHDISPYVPQCEEADPLVGGR